MLLRGAALSMCLCSALLLHTFTRNLISGVEVCDLVCVVIDSRDNASHCRLLAHGFLPWRAGVGSYFEVLPIKLVHLLCSTPIESVVDPGTWVWCTCP